MTEKEIQHTIQQLEEEQTSLQVKADNLGKERHILLQKINSLELEKWKIRQPWFKKTQHSVEKAIAIADSQKSTRGRR